MKEREENENLFVGTETTEQSIKLEGNKVEANFALSRGFLFYPNFNAMPLTLSFSFSLILMRFHASVLKQDDFDLALQQFTSLLFFSWFLVKLFI